MNCIIKHKIYEHKKKHEICIISIYQTKKKHMLQFNATIKIYYKMISINAICIYLNLFLHLFLLILKNKNHTNHCQ